MDFFQKISAIWRNVSIVQRALLIAIALTFIVVGVLLTYWARRPDMRVLYSNLDPEEAAKITEKISERNTVYELGSGGRTIYVPKENVFQLRLDMAKEGLPEGGQKGYRIFDDEKIGISPFVQNVNLKRALQEELAKSIQMIDGVVHARIHIVSPEQTLFTSQTGQATASVVLRLKAGYRLSASNIAAIRYLVAGGTKRLESEKVTIVDSRGRLLSSESDQVVAGGAGTVADYRERVEQNLASKVEEMLASVLGPGRTSVKVSAEIDMTSVNTVTETPIKGVPKKEEIKSESETKPGTGGGGNEQAVSGGTKKGETISTEYASGKTVEQKVVLPGEIKSLKVAAVVDLSPADTNETETGDEAAKIMKVSDVKKLIENALGSGFTGNDSLEVVDAQFHRPPELPVDEEPSKWPRYIAIARHSSLGIMALCALLVLKMFSGAREKAAGPAATGQLPEAGVTGGLLTTGTEVSDSSVLRRQIASSLRSNPEQAKQVFSSWLVERGVD